MKRTSYAALAAASLIALSGCNQQKAPADNLAGADANGAAVAGANAIDGTWKADLATIQIEQKPDVFLLKDGKYSCSSCVPQISVPADGAYHAVTGAPYIDSLSVKVVDAKTVQRASRKGDRPIGESTMAVSPDGKMLTVTFKDMSTEGATPVTGKYSSNRVADAAAGAHAISGSWRPAKIENVSDEGLVSTFKVEGDVLNMSTPGGLSFAAKLDGTEAPLKGDPAGTVVSVQKLSDNSYRETDKRDGKVVSIGTFTVGADGKLQVVFEDKERGGTTRYTANRQ